MKPNLHTQKSANLSRTMEQTPYYIELLKQELRRRKQKNSMYSLRALARFFEIDHGILSLILSGKRTPSKRHATLLTKKLALDVDQAEIFLFSIEEARRQNRLKKINNDFVKGQPFKSNPSKEMTVEEFSEIGEWHYSAILELTRVEDFKSNAQWIALELGLTTSQVTESVRKLLKLGLLTEKNGNWIKSNKIILTGERSKSSAILKQRQKESLAKSMKAIDEIPITLRNHVTMTMAIDPKKIPHAKKMIDEFISSLCVFLSTGKQNKLYELAVSLFPLQVLNTKGGK